MQTAEEANVHVIQQKDRDKEGSLYGDLMIRHLWKRQVDTVIDVRITDTDAKSHILHPPGNTTGSTGKGKERK
eukprot:8415930-Ditylum_brightwellii.AAC.1